MVLGIRICPRCGSDEVEMIAGGITGSWMCRNCGYCGSVFPEKEIVGKEQGMKGKGGKKNDAKTTR